MFASRGIIDNRPSFGQTNAHLSEDRDKSVATVLTTELGVPHDVVSTVVGWGEQRPKVKNTTPSDRSKDRRVEFHMEEMATSRSLREMWKNKSATQTLEEDLS